MGKVIVSDGKGNNSEEGLNKQLQDAITELRGCLDDDVIKLCAFVTVPEDGVATVRVSTANQSRRQETIIEKMPLLNNDGIIRTVEWREALMEIADKISQQLGHSVADLTAEESLIIVIPLTSRDEISSNIKKNALKLLDERLVWQKQQLIRLQALHGV